MITLKGELEGNVIMNEFVGSKENPYMRIHRHRENLVGPQEEHAEQIRHCMQLKALTLGKVRNKREQ